MKKVIIEQDKQAIESAVYPYERKCWLLNLFLQRMEESGYPLQSVEQIATVLTTGVEKYIRSSIVDGSRLELAGGIKLNKAAVFDVVEIPDITQSQSVERLLKEYHHIQINILLFEGGKFSVPEDIRKNAIEQHTVYAKNEKQIALLVDGKELAKAANKFYEAHGPGSGRERKYHPLRNVENILTFNASINEYEIDTKVIINLFP